MALSRLLPALLFLMILLVSGQGLSAQVGPQGEPAECTQDSQCDDGLFCNGEEVCADGNCKRQAIGVLCEQPKGCFDSIFCDEELDRFCVSVPNDQKCTTGEFCNPAGECQLVDEGVPTLSEWGLLALTASLLGLGILRLGYRLPESAA